MSLEPVVGPVGVADWVVAGVRGRFEVGSFLPRAFQAYARLLHPAYRRGTEVRWETIAAANGRRAHGGMQWDAIVGAESPGLWDRPPATGTLPAEQARRLVMVLRRFTSTPEDCFYGVWEGFDGLSVPRGGATVKLPGRTMLLLRGPLAGAVTVSMTWAPREQSPNLWWPTDRAWFVATDVDHMCSYVGAGEDCIRALVEEPALEAWPVSADDRVDLSGDPPEPPSPGPR